MGKGRWRDVVTFAALNSVCVLSSVNFTPEKRILLERIEVT